MNVPTYLWDYKQFFTELIERQQVLRSTERKQNTPGVSFYGIVPSLFHGFIPRKLVEGKLLVSLRVGVAARHAASVASSHRLIF